jgi:hypothetical protein
MAISEENLSLFVQFNLKASSLPILLLKLPLNLSSAWCMKAVKRPVRR